MSDRPETARRGHLPALGLSVAAAAAFAWLVSQQHLWAVGLGKLFPASSLPPGTSAVYATPLVDLTVQHIAIVAASSALTIAVGLPLGIWVTRPSGRDFRDIVAATVDFGQTFPPVAVLALLVASLGFGFGPAVIALFLYGLFPVVSSTVAGIDAVSSAVVDAATGIGLGRGRILLTIELPLAARVIMGGIRTSVIINVGTATVAAAVAAGGLGEPILNGINIQNTAWILEGALAAGLLAVVVDQLIARVEDLVTPDV